MDNSSVVRCCESTLEERRAGNPHAAFCGSRRRVTASGDPVLGVKLPGATHLDGVAEKGVNSLYTYRSRCHLLAV